jgi:hypothetical protein
LAKLEAASRDSRVVVNWRHHSETNEQAEARWRAENSDEDLEGGGLKVVIVGWGDPEPETGASP